MVKKHNVTKGNPHQITIKQHIIPKRSIERFCNEKGFVITRLIKQEKTIPLNSKNEIFCAIRCWDQITESCMTSIENCFQKLCEKIITEGIDFKIHQEENAIITQYFALWHSRYYYNKNPENNWELEKFSSIERGKNFTQDEAEGLEEKGKITLSVDINGTTCLPSHHATGQMIINSIINFQNLYQKTRWGVLISKGEKEFVVPDIFGKMMSIPIVPKICLFSYEENQYISDSEVEKINSHAIAFSKDYFFARNFKYCF